MTAVPASDALRPWTAATSLPQRVPVVVVGAGPAGLATSRELIRHGLEHVVLERGDQPAFVWANLYDSLTLHTGRHMSGLPGRPIPRDVALFPPRSEFVRYLLDYARSFSLPVHTRAGVRSIRRKRDDWVLALDGDELRASMLVMATGIVSSPRIPALPGHERFGGRVMHSAVYRRPSSVAGKRVLVVGVGNSGGEIASELANAGFQVDISVRSGANVVPRDIAGVPIQYLAYWLRKLPGPVQQAVSDAVRSFGELRRGPSPLPRPSVGPLDAIPLIGFHLVDAIKAGLVRVRPGVSSLTESGAQFVDGSDSGYDTVLLATGFQPALEPLGALVKRDSRGFAFRTDRVTSADQPNLWFVGHNYDATGGLANIARDAPLAAAAIALKLRATS